MIAEADEKQNEEVQRQSQICSAIWVSDRKPRVLDGCQNCHEIGLFEVDLEVPHDNAGNDLKRQSFQFQTLITGCCMGLRNTPVSSLPASRHPCVDISQLGLLKPGKISTGRSTGQRD